MNNFISNVNINSIVQIVANYLGCFYFLIKEIQQEKKWKNNYDFLFSCRVLLYYMHVFFSVSLWMIAISFNHHLMFDFSDEATTPKATISPGGSSASSRDGSPSRDTSPLTRSLKPPIILKRGARGFGFSFRSVRVYIGESNVYTLQHIVTVSWVQLKLVILSINSFLYLLLNLSHNLFLGYFTSLKHYCIKDNFVVLSFMCNG